MGDLEGDGDAAAREAEHDRVCAAQVLQPRGQAPAGIHSVVESHDPPPAPGPGPEDGKVPVFHYAEPGRRAPAGAVLGPVRPQPGPSSARPSSSAARIRAAASAAASSEG
ncbi:hypothetical protein GCM10010357_43480 [Streptomyces luteireticuli]|uniref:Uncharacterized protein n=1 Tax=Streptomyces luteireticuli TaxID=173858 RepID=A0ABN0YXJ3_9ACTN